MQIKVKTAHIKRSKQRPLATSPSPSFPCIKIDVKLDKNEFISGICNERLSLPIFKLHVHLGLNHFFIEFLKSTRFFTNLIFCESEFRI